MQRSRVNRLMALEAQQYKETLATPSALHNTSSLCDRFSLKFSKVNDSHAFLFMSSRPWASAFHWTKISLVYLNSNHCAREMLWAGWFRLTQRPNERKVVYRRTKSTILIYHLDQSAPPVPSHFHCQHPSFSCHGLSPVPEPIAFSVPYHFSMVLPAARIIL